MEKMSSTSQIQGIGGSRLPRWAIMKINFMVVFERGKWDLTYAINRINFEVERGLIIWDSNLKIVYIISF